MENIFFEKNGETMTKHPDGFEVSKTIHEKTMLEQYDFFAGAMSAIIADSTISDNEKTIVCANIVGQLAMKDAMKDMSESLGAIFDDIEDNNDSDEFDDDNDEFDCENCDVEDCSSHPKNVH